MNNKIRFGIQGGIGSFNEQALKEYIQNTNISSYEIQYLYTTQKVLESINDQSIDYGVFAIVNSLGGLVEETLNVLGKYDFIYHSQISISICHYLMKLRDVPVEDISKITAHPQVLTQCKNNLKLKYPLLSQVSGTNDLIDTAKFTEALSEGNVDRNTYVLGPRILSSLYGLEICDEHLEDRPDNRTTFLIVKSNNESTIQ